MPFSSVLFFPITLNESWFPGQFLFKRKKESRRKQVWKLIAPTPRGDFPKTISLSLSFFFFLVGAGGSLQGNLVILKWPLKLKTMEKLKEKHKVIGDK